MSFSPAEQKTDAANKLYEIGNYLSALELYSEAIGLDSENATAYYYCNRSQCLIKLGYYKSALVDSQLAVALDERCEEGYDCFIRCCLSLGNIADAENAIEQLNRINVNNEYSKKYEKQCQKLRSIGMMVEECLIDGEEDFVEAGTYYIGFSNLKISNLIFG